MEKRKIVYVGGKNKPYQILKPKPKEDENSTDAWYEYGKNKSLKAVSDLLSNHNGNFELYINEGIIYDVSLYRRECAKRTEDYLSKKGLEAKTI